jgi:hypothetical protein
LPVAAHVDVQEKVSYTLKIPEWRLPLMEDKFKISKPNQGVNTLVSELSVLRIEKTIKKLKGMRSKGIPEKDIRAHIDTQHKDLDQRSRTHIYRISLGLIPKDDVTKDDLDAWKNLNETTLEIILREPNEEFHECSLVFFESQLWVVVSRKGEKLVLKRFSGWMS